MKQILNALLKTFTLLPKTNTPYCGFIKSFSNETISRINSTSLLVPSSRIDLAQHSLFSDDRSGLKISWIFLYFDFLYLFCNFCLVRSRVLQLRSGGSYCERMSGATKTEKMLQLWTGGTYFERMSGATKIF